ncbi:hypothetical protein SAMN05216338_100263 [Bradyrhizobium sp. Rc2d]|nr:hypothetical protein SAMN05216338_100263 [Bradyrhizobium sp. Rc2d]
MVFGDNGPRRASRRLRALPSSWQRGGDAVAANSAKCGSIGKRARTHKVRGKDSQWLGALDQARRRCPHALSGLRRAKEGPSTAHKDGYVCRASKLGVSQKRLQWTAADVSRLRRIYPSGTDADLAAAFPAFTKRQVQAVANRLRISKKKRYKRTGIAIIDAIRDRALELNLTMIDLDALAKNGCYFQKCCRELPYVNGPYVYRAIVALGSQAR